MSDKILYARVQAPMVVLSEAPSSVQNLPSKRGEILICKDTLTDTWGIKIGDGNTSLKNLNYLYPQLQNIKISNNFDVATDYLDQPKKILVEDVASGRTDLFQFKIVENEPAQLQPNTIYFIYSAE